MEEAMGKIIITEFASLDGVCDAPEKWSLAYWNSEMEKFKTDELAQTDGLLLGRVTYDGFAEAWPSRKGDFADRFNALPKFVVSQTLKDPAWNHSNLLNGPVKPAIEKLKSGFEGELYVHGSLSLARLLIATGLADEIHLLIYPLLLGSGKRLFGEGDMTKLELVHATTFSSGILALKYRPAAAQS
jgi:dihydrofolate reductase